MSATTAGLLQLGLLLLALAAVYVPFGNYLARVYTADRHWRVERAVYRVVRRRPGLRAALDRLRRRPARLLLPVRRAAVPAAAAAGAAAAEPRPRPRSTRGSRFNTAVSFVTNTNWQSYVPETVMGHLVQMAGLTVQNFVSAAVGMAVAVALVRGFVRAGTDRIGNFWVDLIRGSPGCCCRSRSSAAIVLVALRRHA